MAFLKKLPATALGFPTQAGHHYRSWHLVLPPGTEFKDLFDPTFWAHHHQRLGLHDTVRCVAADGSFDFLVTVRSKAMGGVVMDLWPRMPADYSADVGTATTERVVPILAGGKPAVRVDYTEATKWRVIGLAGDAIVTDLATEDDAQRKLAEYLATLKLRMPTQEEIAAAVAAREKAQAERDAAAAAKRTGGRRPAA